MKLEEAKEQAKKYQDKAPNGKATETLCVIADMGVFVNNDIKHMRKLAEARKKEIFVFKGEAVKVEAKVEAKAEAKVEAKKPAKKSKKKK